MTARRTVLPVSDHAQRSPPRHSLLCGPAVSKTGVVLDVVEMGVAVAELLADTLDEGADIGAVPLCSVPGDEILAVDEIIDLAVADVLPRFFGEKRQDLEFRQGKIDGFFRPYRSADVEAQLQSSERHLLRAHRLGIGSRSRAVGDQLQSLDQDRQAPRFVDK